MTVTPTPDEPLKDLAWLSEYLGDVPERTIYAWRRRGQGPPAYRVGAKLRYRPAEVDAWLAGHRDPSDAA